MKKTLIKPGSVSITAQDLKRRIESYNSKSKDNDSDSINLNPPWQRAPVWTTIQKQNLIETIFKFGRIPLIIVNYNGQYCDSIDGKQKSLAILDFMDDKFKTNSNIPGLENKLFSELDKETQRFFKGEWNITIDTYPELNANQVSRLFHLYNNGQKLSKFDQFNGTYSSNAFYLKCHEDSNIVENYISTDDKNKRALLKRNMIVPTYCFFFNTILCEELNLQNKGYSHVVSQRILSRIEEVKIIDDIDLYEKHKNKVIRALKTVERRSEEINLVLYTEFIAALSTKNLKQFASLKGKIKELLVSIQYSFVDNPKIWMDEATVAKDQKYQTRLRNHINNELDILFENAEPRFFSKQQKLEIKKRDKVCQMCHTEDANSFDHINPHSEGGKTSIENGQLLCKTCNSSKGSK